jgi:hypothetical protein
MNHSIAEQHFSIYSEAVLQRLQFTFPESHIRECSTQLLDYAQRLPSWQVALPLVSCLAVGGSSEGGSVLACGWIAAYLASEILDHVEDKEFIQDEWASSPEVATNLATGLIFMAYRFLCLIQEPERVSLATKIFSEAGLSAALGQQRALLESQESVEVALNNYWEMIILKAGSVFQAATSGGAVVGTTNEKYRSALGDYGIALGVMLQLIDDCRDVLTPSLEAPKWEVSLPLLLYLMTIGEKKIYFPDLNSKQKLIGCFMKAGVIDAISSLLLEWQQRALISLEVLEESTEKQLLEIIPSLFLENLSGSTKKVLDGSSHRA